MRRLRQLSMALMFTLALATCASAGIIGTGPEAPPPPSATSTGIASTSIPAESVAAPSHPVLRVALDLLQSVLLAF